MSFTVETWVIYRGDEVVYDRSPFTFTGLTQEQKDCILALAENSVSFDAEVKESKVSTPEEYRAMIDRLGIPTVATATGFDARDFKVRRDTRGWWEITRMDGTSLFVSAFASKAAEIYITKFLKP